MARNPRLVLLVLVFLSMTSNSQPYRPGDIVPMSKMGQYHSSRTVWNDMIGRHCPIFGVNREVLVPIAKPTGYTGADPYKISFQVGKEKFLVPWLLLINRKTTEVPMIDVHLRYSGNDMLGVTAKVVDMPHHYIDLHPDISKQFWDSQHWPKHVLVRYPWEEQSEIDVATGFYVLFGSGRNSFTMSEQENEEARSLALTPTWSVATVLTIFVAVSLLVERSIHRLCNWLRKTNRKPLLAAVEKMKEELMLLGFISLLLTATSSIIANICISSKFYNSAFAPCTRSEVDEDNENASKGRKLLTAIVLPHLSRRVLNTLNENTCKQDYEPFVSYEGLEQLHRFIFVMAITHISYSCLTMLLAVVKIHSWRAWEDEALMDRNNFLHEIAREKTMQRQSSLVRFHTSQPLVKNGYIIWMICFFRQFGSSVVRADYLTLRKGFIANHNLTSKYDFHSYMIRSMEEEFQRIVGVSAPLWGFVVAFMLFNVKGSNLYFWIAIIPVALVLLVGTKLQHVIATLALESAGITGLIPGTRLKPRDELFWFKKPELLLTLIHFILFQNAFELASFFWFWWQFGYNSCFIKNHTLVYLRLTLGFAGQFLCSYSTLPLYALVTQMGTNYKAALIPQRIRETIHGWGKDARKRRRHKLFGDDSTVHTDTSTVLSVEEYEDQLDSPQAAPHAGSEIELQPPVFITTGQSPTARLGTPLLRSSASNSAALPSSQPEVMERSSSLPPRRNEERK